MAPIQIVYLFFLIFIVFILIIVILRWPSQIKIESSPQKGMTKPKIDLLLNVLTINIWVPYVFSEILLLVPLSAPKKADQNIADFIDSNRLYERSNFCKEAERNFKKNQIFKEQLKKTNFSLCDVAFLNELLFMVCSGKLAEPPKSKEYIKNCEDEEKAEYYLKEIKFSRNILSHDKSKTESEGFADKLVSTYIPGLIRTVCKSYRLQSKIITLRKKFDGKFKEIESDLIQNHERRSKLIGDLLTNDYLKNLKAKYKNASEMDFDDFNEVFIRNLNTGERFNCTEIAGKLTEKFSVMYGIFGSGKSTLMRKMLWSIVNEDNDFFSNSSKKFKLHIYIPCQSIRYDNMADFIKSILPYYLASYSNEEVLDTVRSIEGLLFLVDDVSDQSHSRLVREVVEICKNIPSSSCIISARFTDDINELFKFPEPLEFDSFMIESITDLNDQILFLKRYGHSLKSQEDLQHIVQCFKNLKEPLRLIFQSPAILGSLISKEKVHIKMKSDIDILEGLYNFIELSIDKMLCNEGIDDREMTLSNIVRTFKEYSLRLLKKDTNFISEIDFIDLRDKLKQFCPGLEHILSIILSINVSSKDKKVRIWYFHKPIQEYLIVRNVLLRNELDESSGMNLTVEMLKEDLQLNELNENKDVILMRYGNILRLLMLKLLSEEKIDKISKAMTELMKNVIRPDLSYGLDLIIDMEYHKSIIKIFANSLDIVSKITVFNFEHLIALGHILYENNKIGHLSQEEKELYRSKNAKLLDVHLLESYRTFFTLRTKCIISLSGLLEYGNCHIDSFIGCVDWGIIKALKNVLVESSDSIFISVSTLKDINLMELHGISRVIDVCVKYGEDYSDYDLFQLPMNCHGAPPVVRISDIPANGLEHVERMICSLRPTGGDGSFNRLLLVRCSLTLSQVEELLKILHIRRIRTHSDVTEVLELRSKEHSEAEKYDFYELKLVNEPHDVMEHLDLPDIEDFTSGDSVTS